MKWCSLFLMLTILPCHAQNLKDYQWKNRLVILCGNTQLPKLKQQRQTLLKQKSELEERDMLLLYADSNMLETLDVDRDYVGILLVGKDGSIKFKEAFVVAPSTLFTLIDGMPMRKAEIQKQKKKSGK